jgi:PAS domain S-box-containing protein
VFVTIRAGRVYTMDSGGPTSDVAASERSFRLLVQGVVDYAICMLDPRGLITTWNAGAERIKGYTASEIIGQHFSEFYTPEDRQAGLPARSLQAARREGKFEADGWRLRKDGTKFLASVVIDPIYENGSLVGFAKITRDITERQKAQLDLAESEAKFRMLVSGVTDYALYMLDPVGTVTNWNAGGQRIKGYTADEIVGQNFSRFYTETDRAAGRPQRALGIAKTTGRYEEEGWRVRKDGTFFWASVIIDPIRDDSGKLVGFAKITRDISERREAQQKLEKMQKQLAESQKMDALGQLTGGVAHDFNNLLMIVSGNVQTLKKTVGDDPKAIRALSAIEVATQRGASLTRQLLTFSRRQSVNPETINVAQEIRSLRDVLNSGLGGTVSLAVDIEPSVWPVKVDLTEFETAIINTVVNARDAMPEGGSVTITAKNIEIVEGEHEGEHVAITIEDTGVGIPQDVVSRVFEPFFTTKPVGKGTGLGLSQVHGFAHQAGGTVSISSELGVGTSITICLPRAALGNDVNETMMVKPGAGMVLLVEDNPDVADASAALLEQLGYSVRRAADAEAALDEIERDGITLVFSDVVMPGKLDGVGLARIIREKHPQLPILLTTGYSGAAHQVRTDFPILRKPYLIHELSQAISNLVR